MNTNEIPQSIAPTIQESVHTEQSQKRTCKIFFLYSYLYFIQGLVPGFASTMPFIYNQLPDNSTMILFNLIHLPFSLKFIIAPFLEKYSFVIYGKRKTWMLISLTFTSISIFIMSFYTDMKYANIFAVLCIITQTFLTALDISSHASMVKQLKQSEKPTVILNYAQAIGYLIGGLLFLKLTSRQFALSIGLQNSISTPQTIIFLFFLISTLPIIYIHFQFQETVLKSQIGGQKLGICQIISYYSIFFNTSSRYFRTCLYFFIQIQGFNFFDGLYVYNLTAAGFSRNTYNTFFNLILIPKIIIIFYVASWAKFIGGFPKTLVIMSIILITAKTYTLIFFPLQQWIVFLYVAINQIGSLFFVMAMGILVNSFPINALSGMFITLTSSFSNFSRLQALHIWISGLIGWKLASFIGQGIQIIITLCIYRLYEWMQQGDVSVPKQIQEQFQLHNYDLHEQKEEQLENK